MTNSLLPIGDWSVVQHQELRDIPLIFFFMVITWFLLLTLQTGLGIHLIGTKSLQWKTSSHYGCNKFYEGTRNWYLQWTSKRRFTNGLLTISTISMHIICLLVLLSWALGFFCMKLGWILRWDIKECYDGLAHILSTASHTTWHISYEN